MKSKLYFLIALLGVLFYSCENDINESVSKPASASQAIVTVIDTVGDITADVARYVAESYTKTAQTRNSVTKNIKEIIPVNDEKGVASLYIVNYENNQGYLILSGVNEYQPILAFSERGNFDINRKDDGTSVWLEEQQAIIKNVNVLPDSIRWNNKKAWNSFFIKKKSLQLLNDPQTRSVDKNLEYEVGVYIEESLAQWEREGYQIYSYRELENLFSGETLEQIHYLITQYAEDRFFEGYESTIYIRVKTIPKNVEINPLLKSQWNQIGGYEVNGYPAGCVAVAMAQIMRYHKYPVLYNWDAMPYNYSTNTTVLFLTEIGKKVNMNYGKDGSSAYVADACNAFKQYGYRNAYMIGHTQARTIGELYSNRPVFMSGGTHSWVCDGYKEISSFEDCEVMILDKMAGKRIPPYMNVYKGNTNFISNKYFHMNWGWGGSKDGFFYDENVNPAGHNYASNREDIISIYPN